MLQALFVILLIPLIFNFKRFFMIYLALDVWISCFFSPQFSVYNNLHLAIVPLFLWNYRKDIHKVKFKKFPLTIPFILLFVSFTLSNFKTGNVHYAWYFSRIIGEILIVLMFWVAMEVSPQKSIKTFYKASLFFALGITVYSLFETATRSNPLVTLFSNMGLYNEPSIITEVRFGLKRSQSVFLMHTTFGTLCGVLFAMFFSAYSNIILKSKRNLAILLLLLAFCTFATGTRSCIVGFGLILLSQFSNFNKTTVAMATVILLVLIFGGDYLDKILDSIFNTEAVQGSNSDMRDTQFAISAYYMMQNFWLGHGLQYTFTDVLPQNPQLLGAESLWFPTMIDLGMMGIIAYASFFIAMIIYALRHGRKMYVFFAIAELVVFSMTSVPQFAVTHTFFYLYMMCKFAENKSNHNQIMEKIKPEIRYTYDRDTQTVKTVS